tara:strand:+ start:2580 stop:4913 length:2334 start_codon:yes stop_codon:yes gene_type:complete
VSQQLIQEIQSLVGVIKKQTTAIDDLVKKQSGSSSTGGGAGTDKKRTEIKTQADLSSDLNKSLDAGGKKTEKLTEAMSKMGSAVDTAIGAGTSAMNMFNRTVDMANSKYDTIQDLFGGLGDITNVTNETSKTTMNAIDSIYSDYLGNTEKALRLTTTRMIDGKKHQIDVLTNFYDDEAQVGRNYLEIREELAQRQSLKINEMTDKDLKKLSVMEKGLAISNTKVSEILERQISLSGEASTKVFDEISAHANAVASHTGVSFQEISGQIADIITDVERFGNVQVDEAARIAGALNQLGLSYRGFGGMVDKFMNFDSAAESLGNLTTVFGVHFDAMEMMQLANEDQEEFLYRMREAFMDSGKAIEDMTLAEKKLAAQQMGMSVQDFENFMQEDRILDVEGVSASQKEIDSGFDTMTQQMSMVSKSGEDMKNQLKRKMMDPLSRDAKQLGDEFTIMKGKMVVDPEKFLPGYQEVQEYVRNTTKAVGGTTDFSTVYLGELERIRGSLSEIGGLGAKDIEELRKEITKLEKTGSVSYANMVQLAFSQFGSPEFRNMVLGSVGGAVDVGVDATDAIIEASKDKIDKGMKIDDSVRKKQIDETIKGTIEQYKAGIDKELDKKGLKSKSPAPASGQVIFDGILDGIKELITPETAKKVGTVFSTFKATLSEQVKGLAGASPLFSMLEEGNAKISVESPNLIEKLQGLNEKAVLAATNAEQQSNEKVEALTSTVEALQDSVKKMTDKDTIIQNVVTLDGTPIARYLMNYKGTGGESFKMTTSSEVS